MAKKSKKKTKAKRVKKTVRQTKKPAAKKKAAKKKKPTKAKKPALPAVDGLLIGRVTHFFPHVNAAALIIKKGGIRVGDTLYYKGHTTDFKQAIVSMQIDHKPVALATKGDEVGIQVGQRVRMGDRVYKLN